MLPPCRHRSAALELRGLRAALAGADQALLLLVAPQLLAGAIGAADATERLGARPRAALPPPRRSGPRRSRANASSDPHDDLLQRGERSDTRPYRGEILPGCAWPRNRRRPPGTDVVASS